VATSAPTSGNRWRARPAPCRYRYYSVGGWGFTAQRFRSALFKMCPAPNVEALATGGALSKGVRGSTLGVSHGGVDHTPRLLSWHSFRTGRSLRGTFRCLTSQLQLRPLLRSMDSRPPPHAVLQRCQHGGAGQRHRQRYDAVPPRGEPVGYRGVMNVAGALRRHPYLPTLCSAAQRRRASRRPPQQSNRGAVSYAP
jgi:hypothetical protein